MLAAHRNEQTNGCLLLRNPGGNMRLPSAFAKPIFGKNPLDCIQVVSNGFLWEGKFQSFAEIKHIRLDWIHTTVYVNGIVKGSERDSAKLSIWLTVGDPLIVNIDERGLFFDY